LEWTRENLYNPLVERFGKNKVFFDMTTIPTSVSWISTISSAIENCKIFIPVYSQDYFRKDFCQWEMELGFLRDPYHNKRIIHPIKLNEAINIPLNYQPINAIDLKYCDQEFIKRLFEEINKVL
jgi:hypothetical protein